MTSGRKVHSFKAKRKSKSAETNGRKPSSRKSETRSRGTEANADGVTPNGVTSNSKIQYANITVEISRQKFDAVLFDMDGVVTKTVAVHSAAWKATFDDFLRKKSGSKFKEFTQSDYLRFVDGKSREDGVSSFLKSRKIKLPRGTPRDAPGFKSLYAIGNLKNKRFNELLKTKGVEVYETTVGLIRSLKAQGFKIAIITASKNASAVLKAANLSHVFDAKVDGVDAQKLGLPGKPAPDVFLHAAKELGVSPERAIVVEDAAAGVEAGKNGHFGLVIGVARSADERLLKEHGATIVVRDLGEVAVSGDAKTTNAVPGTALAELEICTANWILSYDSFDPENERRRESLCAIGNGYFCTRGAAPESRADGVHYPGTYLAGVYNRLKYGSKHNDGMEFEELVNMPNWLFVTFQIGSTDWFDLNDVEILSYQQRLNLYQGILYRDIQFRDRDKRETKLSQRWFVHMRHAHLAAIETTITALNWSDSLTIRSAIDGQVENKGTQKDPHMSGKHLEPLESSADDTALYLKVATNQSHITVAMAASNSITHSSNKSAGKAKYTNKPQFVAQDSKIDLKKGESVTLRKIVAIHTSRDDAISEAGLAALRTLSLAPQFEDLLQEQLEIWQNLWNSFDLFIETTEEHSKMVPSLLLHLHSFHALQTASPNIVDLDVGIPARGWTGEGYQGHIFWDDLFIFPFINLRMPNIAQALLKYRYRRLPEARQYAISMGARGARFPWQSGSTGSEDTPKYVWIPKKGSWDPDHSRLQTHVNAAIAYNIWQYYQVTENRDFMHFYGAEIFLEIARFYATFAKYNKKTDHYEIRGVMGPDEYHNAYPDAKQPGLNNNAYTNVMAAWILSTASELLKKFPADYKELILHRLKIDKREIDLWERMSKRMYVPFMQHGLIEQFDGYGDLTEFPWHTDDGQIDMEQLARVLDEQGLVLNQYKVSKQPDVLMLFYVFSADELKELFDRLGYKFDYGDIARNIEYYMARTANTSTLSRVALAWVLSRLDRIRSWSLMKKICPKAKHRFPEQTNNFPGSWTLFLEALGSDLFAIQGGSTTDEGIHMGAMAGTLDIVQRCYSGMVTRDDVLWFSPQLPDALTRLSFNLHYRNQALVVDITHDSMKITARHSSADAIKIGFKNKVYELNAGESHVFNLSRKKQSSSKTAA